MDNEAINRDLLDLAEKHGIPMLIVGLRDGRAMVWKALADNAADGAVADLLCKACETLSKKLKGQLNELVSDILGAPNN